MTSANLTRANLKGALLQETDLSDATLNQADLRAVHMNADLTDARLIKTNLRRADVVTTDFSDADLNDADFTKAKVGWNVFGDNDLSVVIGLDTVRHESSSIIGVDTLKKSRGNIPEVFLRGCGLSDWEIENAKLYNPDLSNQEINDIQYRIHDLRVSRALQINPLFISYSHSNTDFVDTIEKYLVKKGIRFWRDIHHATAGRLETQIDKAIHMNDVVLLVLSEHSTSSDWVEHEARKAREKEKKTGKDAMCPIALDDRWKTCHWPVRLREQIMEYNILDFSNWKDSNDFQKVFDKLLEGLNLFINRASGRWILLKRLARMLWLRRSSNLWRWSNTMAGEMCYLRIRRAHPNSS
jgi:uncharacterized protein YjbI with pentapeptide repeats